MNISEWLQKIKYLWDCNLFFWLDHFELYLVDFDYLTDFFWKDIFINSEYPEDNKSAFYIDLNSRKFKIDKIFPKWYSHWFQFSTSIDDTPVVLFAVNFPQNEEHRKSLVIHSTFFITQNYTDINICEFIQENFLVDSIRRIDIAIDLPILIQKLLSEYFSWVHFHSQIWKDSKAEWFHQTYYIWQLQSDINSKYLIRIYDKLLDTFKKNKWFLYEHLKDNLDVRRIELELRRDECQRLEYSYIQILENKNYEIQKIFSHYMNKHWNINIPTNLSLTPYQYNQFDLKTVFAQTWFIPHRYLSSVRWYLKKVISNTWYRWLSQVLSTCTYDSQWKIITMNRSEQLKFLEQYILYLQETWIQKSLIKKILKKHT